jgi:hypothetical protein
LGNSPVSVTGRLSSFGGQEGALAARAPAGGLPGGGSFHLAAGWQAARNGYPYPSDNGTAYVAGDDHWREMGNNAYRGSWLGLTWRDEGRGRTRSLGARWDAYRKEYPGVYTGGSRAFTDRGDLVLHGRMRDSLESACLGLVDGVAASFSARFARDAFRDRERRDLHDPAPAAHEQDPNRAERRARARVSRRSLE